MKLALIEDDETLSFAIATYFKKKTYQVQQFYTLKDAFEASIDYDLYLVDVSLPDGTGFDFVKSLRKHSKAPVIFLTAKDSQANIIQGFDSGADDYITKSFSFVELDKRIQAILKRTEGNLLNFKDLTIDTSKAQVLYQGSEINLSVQEYRLLLQFIKNPGVLVNRKELNELLNIFDPNIQDNTLNVAMGRLRKKLENIVEIKTVIKKGYILQNDTERS